MRRERQNQTKALCRLQKQHKKFKASRTKNVVANHRPYTSAGVNNCVLNQGYYPPLTWPLSFPGFPPI